MGGGLQRGHAQLQLDSGCLRPDCLELGNLHATKAHTGLRCVSVGPLALQASEAPGFIPSTGKQDQAPLGPGTMSTSGLVSVLFWLEVGQPPSL